MAASASGRGRVGGWTTWLRADGRLAYQECARAGLVTTVGVGVLVAFAPILPLVIRSVVLVLGLTVWTAAVALCAVAGLLEASRRIRNTGDFGILIVGVFGLGVVLLATTQIELIHTLFGRPALTWSWRWDLNHAQAIARTGGLTQSLDYSGVAIRYHVGPAWLAGGVQRVFGAGLTHVLFGVVPLVSVLSIVIALLSVLRASNLRYRYALVGVTLALTVPLPSQTPWGVASVARRALVMPQSWPFLPTLLMLNSLLALAIGGASLALLLDRSTKYVGLAVAALGLASLTQTKPQYYVGFGLLAGLLGITRLLEKESPRRDARVLIAAAASLLLAVVYLAVLPGDPQWFTTPAWHAASTRGLYSEVFRASTFLAIAALVSWRLTTATRVEGVRHPGVTLLLASLTTLVVVSGILYFVDFPFRADLQARLLALEFVSNAKAVSSADALGQSLEAPRLVLLASGFAIIAAAVLQAGRWRSRACQLIAVTIMASPMWVLITGFTRPAPDYATAEDVDLKQVLARIPMRGTLLIASDLADPAQHHRRPLQAMLLTAYGGHPFYVANLRYVNYIWPDAMERIGQLRSFFGSAWSPWHSAWLQRTGVTHVLIDDRCMPPWAGEPVPYLRSMGRVGRWTAFEVAASAVSSTMPEQPPSGSLHPSYGIADCLSGRTFGDYWTAEGWRPEAFGRAAGDHVLPLEGPERANPGARPRTEARVPDRASQVRN